MEDGAEFVDAESGFGSNKVELNFRQIFLDQLQRTKVAGNTELRGGYDKVSIKIIGNMQIKETERMPDEFEIFSNCVSVLADIASPHFDAAMKKADEELSQKMFAVPVGMRDKRKAAVRQLFRELNAFAKRKKYFEPGVLKE